MSTKHQRLSSSTTSYGTGALNMDEVLSAKRQDYVKWGIISTVAGIAVVLFSFFHGANEEIQVRTQTTGNPSSIPVTSSIQLKQVIAFESTYIDGVKRMMQPVQGLIWQKIAEGTQTNTVQIDTSRTFQEILGFGGAFTEAAAIQFKKLPKNKQKEVLDLYFNKDSGSGYTVGRIPMGSCDFSVSSYSYAEVANDTLMTHFDRSVSHDQEAIIPFILRALEVNQDLKLFLSPWSPPAWMKNADPANNYKPSMLGSAFPNGLKEEARDAYALYFSKFITAYKKHGIPFWGLTPQNEPEYNARWEACLYTPGYEAEFIAGFLGPVIKRDHPHVKIMLYDHNRNSVRLWGQTLAKYPDAQKYVDGIAFHWYDDNKVRTMDGVNYHERLNDTHHLDSSKFILATESCNCPGIAKGEQAWFRAQRYAHDILTDLNNWAIGWVDWNLLLDHTGGPNHLGNNCDAPIILDESEKNFFIQPMYYAIQHFSKFVVPGSKRIQLNVDFNYPKPGQDPLLFIDYPSGLYQCDNSSRQLIHKTKDNKLQITNSQFCIDHIPVDKQGIRVLLVECQYTQRFWTFGDDGTIRAKADECLVTNYGSMENGARLVTEKCVPGALHQRWHFKDGKLLNKVSNEMCVTAGYAFFQSVAFQSPSNQTILVVLNENTEDAHFKLQEGGYELETNVPKGGISTYVW
jgi:glucosylceramidase